MFRRTVQGCWLPPPFAYFPFTSPPVRHRVPSGSERPILGFLPRVQAAGSWHWPTTHFQRRGCVWVRLYLCFTLVPSWWYADLYLFTSNMNNSWTHSWYIWVRKFSAVCAQATIWEDPYIKQSCFCYGVAVLRTIKKEIHTTIFVRQTSQYGPWSTFAVFLPNSGVPRR